MALNGAALRVERGDGALSLLDERWDDLVLRQPRPNPTLTATWLRSVAAREPGVPLTIALDTGDRLEAGGAFALRRPLGRRGPWVARWLGESAVLMSPDILVGGPETPRLIVDALLGEASAAYLGLAAMGGAIAEGLLQRAPWMSLWRRSEGWVAPLPPEPLERRRRKVSYLRRRAERAGARVEVRVLEDPEELAPALERLFVLHEQRWCGRGEVARFAATEELRDWFRGAVGAMAERSEARVVEVLEDGEAVAGVLGLLAGRGAMFHTTATRLGGRLASPGHLAMLAFVDAAQAAGATTLDLGRGSGELGGPKADLHPARVPFAGIFAARSWAAQQLMEAPLALLARTHRISEERS